MYDLNQFKSLAIIIKRIVMYMEHVSFQTDNMHSLREVYTSNIKIGSTGSFHLLNHTQKSVFRTKLLKNMHNIFQLTLIKIKS